MSTSFSRLGDKIVDRLKADGFYPPSATPSQEARSRAEWKAIVDEVLKELTDHMDIQLQASDIKVDPGSFEEHLPTDGPITGVGESQATTLTQRLK